jgi:hypothetical protein
LSDAGRLPIGTIVSLSSVDRSEVLSPELVLVDPELRRRLLSRPSQPATATQPRRPSTWPPLRVAAAKPPAPMPAARTAKRRGASKRAYVFVTAAAIVAVTAVILAQTMAVRPTVPEAPTAPAAAVATPAQTVTVEAHFTPPPPAKHLSAGEKQRLASLLRMPMRDPFAPATPGGG